jgi:hypothetical protein
MPLSACFCARKLRRKGRLRRRALAAGRHHRHGAGGARVHRCALRLGHWRGQLPWARVTPRAPPSALQTARCLTRYNACMRILRATLWRTPRSMTPTQCTCARHVTLHTFTTPTSCDNKEYSQAPQLQHRMPGACIYSRLNAARSVCNASRRSGLDKKPGEGCKSCLRLHLKRQRAARKDSARTVHARRSAVRVPLVEDVGTERKNG